MRTLAEAYPDVARQWHPGLNGELKPHMVSASHRDEVWWQCDNDPRHYWHAPPIKRTQRGAGCAVCKNKQIIVGVNDLATTHPEIAAQWHESNDHKPEEYVAGTQKEATFACSDGHVWSAQIVSRTKLGSGCPYCAGQRIDAGGIATTHPELAKELHPSLNSDIDPNKLKPGSGVEVWWLCPECDHVWKTQVRLRAQKGMGCGQCSGSSFVRVGVNDLASQNPTIAAQWNYERNVKTPTEVSYMSARSFWWVCDKGHEWESVVYNRHKRGCPECARHNFTSAGEDSIAAALASLGLKVERGVRGLIGGHLEVDIWVPDCKFAIEFNGVYWHSEAAGKGRQYHTTKYEGAENAGITLHQVWQDDWDRDPSIVLRTILYRLGLLGRLNDVEGYSFPAAFSEFVSARSCRVTHIKKSTASVFLDSHHIQGSSVGTLYLGLTDSNSELRAVLVATRDKNDWRIDRYASMGVVRGGFSKILAYAERELGVDSWHTFANREVSSGALYENNGFTAEKVLPADYSYLVSGKRVHKFNYRIKRFRDDPTLVWEEGKSERELADMNGLVRIWDSGKIRYVKHVTR